MKEPSKRFVLDSRIVSYLTENKKPSFRYDYAAVAVAFLIIATMWGTFHSFGVFLKPIATELGWTRATISGAFSLSFILMGLLGMVAGKLTDRFGPRVVIVVCGFLLGLGLGLMSQISTIWQLYLFYGAFIGAGMSGCVPSLMSTVARRFFRRRGMMTGIAISGLGVGVLVMSPLANWLISVHGWRTSFFIIGIIVLVLVILPAQLLRRHPRQTGQLSGDGDVERNDLQRIGFSLREAIHSQQFWMFGVALVCVFLGIEAVLLHIVPHAIGLGISAANAATVLAVIGGLGTIGRVVIGSASDRIGNKPALIICFVLVSIALFWLLVAEELWMLYLFAVIFGFGYGGTAALLSPSVAELFGLRSHGSILGVILFSVTIGEASGPVLAGHIFDMTHGYSLAFLLCALVIVIGLILVSFLKTAHSSIK